jgi:hypothetical protein
MTPSWADICDEIERDEYNDGKLMNVDDQIFIFLIYIIESWLKYGKPAHDFTTIQQFVDEYCNSSDSTCRGAIRQGFRHILYNTSQDVQRKVLVYINQNISSKHKHHPVLGWNDGI